MDMSNTGLNRQNFEYLQLNMLMNRTRLALQPEIQARYTLLRTSVLTPEQDSSMFEEYLDSVGKYAVAQESTRWQYIPYTFFDLQTLRKNVNSRFRISDYILQNL